MSTSANQRRAMTGVHVPFGRLEPGPGTPDDATRRRHLAFLYPFGLTSIGSAAGTSSAAGFSGTIASAVGSAGGLASVSGTGRAADLGQAAGTSTATATGKASSLAVGSIAGQSTAAAIGQGSTGSAAGTNVLLPP